MQPLNCPLSVLRRPLLERPLQSAVERFTLSAESFATGRVEPPSDQRTTDTDDAQLPEIAPDKFA
jgi:hypothetical protein